LPALFGPRKAKISPFETVKEILLTAVNPLNFLVRFSTCMIFIRTVENKYYLNMPREKN